MGPFPISKFDLVWLRPLGVDHRAEPLLARVVGFSKLLLFVPLPVDSVHDALFELDEGKKRNEKQNQADEHKGETANTLHEFNIVVAMPDDVVDGQIGCVTAVKAVARNLFIHAFIHRSEVLFAHLLVSRVVDWLYLANEVGLTALFRSAKADKASIVVVLDNSRVN